jgi:Bacterial Ig-like domain
VTAFPTPADYGKPATLTVTIPAGAVTGADGLPLPDAVTLSIDVPMITGPTAVVTSDQTHDNWTSGPIPMDVAFSEQVTGFSANLLTPSPGATVSNFQQNPQDPTRYTFDITPAANKTSVSVGVAPGGIQGKNSGKPLMATPTVFNRNLVAGPIVTSVPPATAV